MPDLPIFIDNQITVTQVRLLWKVYTKGEGESSWSFILPSAAGDPRDIVRDKFNAFLLDKFRVARSGPWHIIEMRVEDRYPQIFAPIVDVVNLGPIDEGTGLNLPPQVTPIISWRTGIEGRSNRGRTYMGPYGVGSMAQDNNVGTPAFEAVQDFAETMMANFTGTAAEGGPFFAIVSRQHNGVALAPGTYTLPTSYTFWGKWGTMRRRNQYEWRS